MPFQEPQSNTMTGIHQEGLVRRQARRTARIACAFILAVALCGAVAGCGGGGDHHGGGGGIVPNPNGSSSLLSGTVTDVAGNPIVGAAVVFNGQNTTSSLEGTYTIPGVTVPAGQASLVGNVQATKTINGQQWSGQNYVEVLSSSPDTSNVHIVMSPSATQNAITGTVTDTSGHTLRGARVFVSNGPFTGTSGGQFFSNLSAIGTATDQNGAYTIPHLPPGTTYTVTASFAGFVNQTFNNVAVNAPPAGPTVQPFQLATSSSSATPPAVTGMSATTFTVPSSPNRSVSATNALAAVKAWILARKGIKPGHAASPSRVTVKPGLTRSTPAGSVIEVDLFWDYVDINNLFGYEVVQATNLNPPNFISIALLRDPQADRFADVDTGLTPDVTYYYSVARLDTINFPSGNVNAGESDPGQTVAVEPLAPITQASPASGVTAPSSTPTFSWSAVNRASLYQIVVYDRYPDITGDSTNPNVVNPIWPVANQNPATDPTVVHAPSTAVTYSGPALVSGHTYYWTVFAQDATGSAISVSPISSFVAP
ncbi:MAG TPA: carboxypeptidase-like regulatory domain-containing protein [Chthonomonadaceae bacterium]|nr:carboxypeptidase-like regulatory domain-containing protein [Chthonomonadaceae bacterium]